MTAPGMSMMTTDHSIFSMLRAAPDGVGETTPNAAKSAAIAARASAAMPIASRPCHWFMLSLLVLAAWAGGVGFLGRYRPSEVSRLLYRCVPAQLSLAGTTWSAGELLLAGGALAAGALLLWALIRRERALAGVAGMTLAYLLGYELYENGFTLLQQQFGMPAYARHSLPMRSIGDGLTFARNRIAFAVPMVLCLLIARITLFRGSNLFHFGRGDWRVASRDFSMKGDKQTYTRMMFPSFALCSLGLLLLMQAMVGFRPITTGNLWPLLPALLAAALTNAAVEEAIYRGFMQPAFIAYGGVAAGLWMQGLLFGLVHWGISVGVLAALPVSLLIGLGSVMWGKAALETRGLGWVIVAHFMVDVAIMAAYFVGGE